MICPGAVDVSIWEFIYLLPSVPQSQVGAMIVYTYVYGMLAPPAEAVADVDGKQEAASKAATEPAVVPSSLSNSAGPNETEDFHLLSDQHSDEAQGEGWWAVVNQQMKQLVSRCG